MRTSRVSPVPSSIFRNSRQYLHSNELFYRILEEGNYFSSKQQNQQNKQNHQTNNKRTQQTKVILNRTSKGAILKGLLIDCNDIVQMQNSLLEKSSRISEARNKIKSQQTYRSSV